MSWSGYAFVALRVITQVSGVAVQPTAVAMLNGAVPPERRADAFSAWGFIISAGPALGLVIGGPLVDLAGWQVLFLIQAALAAIAGVLGYRAKIAVTTRQRRRFDVGGSALLACTVLGILLGVGRGFAVGWTQPITIGSFLLSLVGFAMFVVHERRHASPLIPHHLIRSQQFSTAVNAQFFIQANNLGTVAMAALLLRQRFDLSASAAAFVTVMMPIGFGIAAPYGGRRSQRFGQRQVAVAGAVLLIGSMGAGRRDRHRLAVPRRADAVRARLRRRGVAHGLHAVHRRCRWRATTSVWRSASSA